MGEDDKTYSQEIQDRIRELAHSMWEWAGRQQGMALDYWLAAEKEVLATMRAMSEKLMPGEPEKAERSNTEAAEPAPSETPKAAETVAKPPPETEKPEEAKRGATKRTGRKTRS